MAIGDAVAGDELGRHLRAVAHEVRLSGSAEEARAFDYIQAELDRLGYRTSRHASDALVGYPGRDRLEVARIEGVSCCQSMSGPFAAFNALVAEIVASLPLAKRSSVGRRQRACGCLSVSASPGTGQAPRSR